MKSAIIFSLLLPALLCAQEFVFQPEYDTIPVQMNNWNLFCPWVGGFTETAPDFCDIDADGDYDLFVGQFSNGVSFFRNVGTVSSPSFEIEFGVSDSMRSMNDFGHTNPDFCDLDGDGDLDALIGSGIVTLLLNQGNANQPNLNTNPDTLLNTGGTYVFGTHVALADLDADGDYDLVCGEWQGYMILYRNVGAPDSFAFQLDSQPWLGVNVGGEADPVLCDIDADGDLDLFIGTELGKLWYYQNTGTPSEPNFTYVTNNYFGISVGNEASPAFADIDDDNDYDLFIGKEIDGDLRFYENIGTAQEADFVYRTEHYLALDVEGFANASPQLVDIDGDGDLDLLLPSYNRIYEFVNEGTNTDPDFRLADECFQGIITNMEICPAFGDLDGDGDYDLICGYGAIPGPPSLKLYINQGTPSHPNLVLYNANFITNSDFFVLVTPVLTDIDADGDLDLFVQDGDNDFLFYRNNGSADWPPSFTLMTSQWQGIHQFSYPANTGYSFTFGDLDEDGDPDLLMECPEFNNLYFYRNQGTPQVPVMVLDTPNFLQEDVQYLSSPTLADIDADGDLDLFIGDLDAGLYFYRNVTGQVSAPPAIKHPYAGLHLSMGPNPANPSTTLSFTLPFTQALDLSIYNLLGEKVATLLSGMTPAGTHSVRWEGGQHASGVYLVRLKTEQDALTQKITIIK